MKQDREWKRGSEAERVGGRERGERKVEAGKPVEGVQSMKRAIPTKRHVMVCMPALSA